MLIFGDPIIDWSAIWKIVVVALIGGCGIVVVYGFLLLGLKYAGVGGDSGATQTERSRVVGYAIAGDLRDPRRRRDRARHLRDDPKRLTHAGCRRRDRSDSARTGLGGTRRRQLAVLVAFAA